MNNYKVYFKINIMELLSLYYLIFIKKNYSRNKGTKALYYNYKNCLVFNIKIIGHLSACSYRSS